jgi:3-oxoacyl-[acyl-carrier protein] reductase
MQTSPNLAGTPFDLSGRVAIITGAARGIGLAVATVLARAGAHTVLTDIVDVTSGAMLQDLESEGLSAEFRLLDVSNQAAVDALVDDVVSRRGRLDIMVNNAAIIDDTSPLTVTEADLDRVHAVNFKGVVFGSQAAARVMIAAGSGSIINVTSGVVDVATPTVTGYSTSKAAAAQYSRGLAMEVAAKGVRVNTLAPGWTDTPMNERHVLRADGSVDAERKAAYVAMRAASAPMGVAGSPFDQAYAVLYLASDAARFVTGMVMRANGGGTMPW